jgi:hypothetical protein
MPFKLVAEFSNDDSPVKMPLHGVDTLCIFTVEDDEPATSWYLVHEIA